MRHPCLHTSEQDPASSGAHDKALLDQLTQASRRAVPHNIDPAISGVAPAPVGMMGGNHAATAAAAAAEAENAERKGAKRELSTSKRAAQNRAAQRAFRQRKEGHIKKLEEQVRDYGVLLEHFKRLQSENLTLRDYIISLQGRLIESQGEFPQPPMNIDLNAPRDDQLPPGIQEALTQGAGSPMQTGDETQVGGDGGSPTGHAAAPPPPPLAAPTAQMQGVTSQLQGTAAQAVAKGARRSQRDRGEEKSIEERTDPALK